MAGYRLLETFLYETSLDEEKWRKNMEISKSNKKNIIAFYLPQYHTIPENDKWWGEGFTEWTNTKKAVPLFEGHEQPKTPLNENYYDLSDVTVMERQAQLAQKYGVFGFCYYHYWFKDGKKLLEKPIEQMLDDKKVDIPFCLCWANENWTKNWDGGNREIIMEQDYGSVDDWRKHFAYLLQFFKDNRYITWKNRPILIIYKPEQIIYFNKMVDCFNELAIESGFDGIMVLSQYPNTFYGDRNDDLKIDYQIKFQPVMSLQTKVYSSIDLDSASQKLKLSIKKQLKDVQLFQSLLIARRKKFQESVVKQLEINDYDEAWDIILHKEPFDDSVISGGFTSWDNTARNKKGMLFKGASPAKFEKYMTELLKKTSAMNLVFVNAWNEWAEGAYLEPDERYGYAYLEALKKAVDSQ